jgi:hypothetical protein
MQYVCLSSCFEATLTDARVNNVVRVGTRQSETTAINTSQTITLQIIGIISVTKTHL